MTKTDSLKKIAGRLLFWVFSTISLPLFSAPLSITAIDITPTHEGDVLLISYEGNINAITMSVDREKHAILKITQARPSPALKLNKHAGKLIKSLELDTTPTSDTKILIDFKRRLGRHTRQQTSLNGENLIQIELLDEMIEAPPKSSDQSVILPVIAGSLFELTGSKETKPLDYSKNDRKKISTEEFLSLFGTQVKPRPNRITDITYKLTHESLELILALHQQPRYALSTHTNPPRVEFKLTTTLGDFEINHTPIQHDFIGNITSTRKHDNTLEMRTDLYETAEVSSKTIKNPHKQGYLLIINVKRIYPWETETAIPYIDPR